MTCIDAAANWSLLVELVEEVAYTLIARVCKHSIIRQTYKLFKNKIYLGLAYIGADAVADWSLLVETVETVEVVVEK